MGKDTKIEWCDHIVNFWNGCAKVHTGCKNCYAGATPKRFSFVTLKKNKTKCLQPNKDLILK